MTKLNWGETGNRFFSTGVEKGVLYLQNGSGVPWNGLVAIDESPSGSDVAEGYYDGEKFFSRRSGESFSGTIEAFTYPPEFEEYDGQLSQYSNQRRKPFGFSYRTLLGNDTESLEAGFLTHLVYNATVKPAPRDHKSLDESSDISTFSWEFSTTPTEVEGRYGAHLIIDSRLAYPWVIEILEDRIYGSDSSEATLPPMQDIFDLFEDASILRITDHGDGTWTADGPDSAIIMLTSTMFEITWPSAVYLDDVTYKISSL